MIEKIQEAVTHIGTRTKLRPQVGVVLGSGLGAFAASLTDATRFPYRDIPHFPTSGVAGHEGDLVVGTFHGVSLCVLSGRVHAYEGYSAGEVAFGVRVLGTFGIKSLVLTNAAGAINTAFKPGQLMLITDHINLTGMNPLIGAEHTALGQRFIDMTEAYHPKLQDACEKAGRTIGLNLRKGVYVGLLGPSFETPAEIRMMRTCGADAVGMSTVLECVAANQMGIKVLGVSCITNMAAGVLPQKLDHREVLVTADEVKSVLVELLEVVVPALDKLS